MAYEPGWSREPLNPAIQNPGFRYDSFVNNLVTSKTRSLSSSFAGGSVNQAEQEAIAKHNKQYESRKLVSQMTESELKQLVTQACLEAFIQCGANPLKDCISTIKI